MKVTLWISTSVNGMIARSNNTEEFISWESAKLWLEYCKKAGSLVLGRKSYEIFVTWPKAFLTIVSDVPKVVLSSNKNYQVLDDFSVATSPQEVIAILKNKGVTEVVITGGSKSNSSFAKENLIDEVILNIEPVLIGEGLPIFKPETFDLKLKFVEITETKAKTIELHYKVQK